MHTNMQICICICIYIYIYVHTHTHTHTYIYIYTCMYALGSGSFASGGPLTPHPPCPAVITLKRSEVFPPPRRAFLFDMGVGLGGGGESQNWLYNSYQDKGISFDRIFTWEARMFNPPPGAYEFVPAEMLDKMSFFNVPANSSGENMRLAVRGVPKGALRTRSA